MKNKRILGLLLAPVLLGCSQLTPPHSVSDAPVASSMHEVTASMEIEHCDGTIETLSSTVLPSLRGSISTDRGTIEGVGRYFTNQHARIVFHPRREYIFLGWYASYPDGTYDESVLPRDGRRNLMRSSDISFNVIGDIKIIGLFRTKEEVVKVDVIEDGNSEGGDIEIGIE